MSEQAITLALRVASCAGFGVAVGVLAFTAVSSQPRAERWLGLRGLKRQRALGQSALFATLDPWIRLLARWAGVVPLGGARAHLARTLEHAGDWLGLDVDELVALSTLSGISGALAGALLMAALELPPAALPFLAGLGAVAPYVVLTGEVQRRAKSIARALPSAIDIASLSMTAGLSFPQALEQVVRTCGGEEDPLNEELSLIRRQLRLGWTRARALTSFADRVPSQAVRSFVAAVVQSEERGTPLVDVLRIQATTLRQRRSMSGEEAASRAAVLMIVPLTLILAAVVVLLMGPFLIQGMSTGF